MDFLIGILIAQFSAFSAALGGCSSVSFLMKSKTVMY